MNHNKRSEGEHEGQEIAIGLVQGKRRVRDRRVDTRLPEKLYDTEIGCPAK
jgi:hypothetical protein